MQGNRLIHHRVSLLKISFVLAMLLALCAGTVSPVFAETVSPPVVTPKSVQPGAYVFVQVSNLPSNTDFTVTEGKAGTQGLNGYLVSHFNSGDGGTQNFLFETHANVRAEPKIDLRIDGGKGMVAYMTYPNTARLIANTQGAVGTFPITGGPTTQPAYNVIHVLSVQQGGIVKVQIFDMPRNIEFTVTMAKAGDKRSAQMVARVTRTSDLGSVVAYFEIPTNVKYADSLDLRLKAPGFSYFVNFANKDK